jgi:hypothetical protein
MTTLGRRVRHIDRSNQRCCLHHLLDGAGQKRGQKSKGALLRPIICICNDPNAAVLAKLRPHAYQLRFTRPSDFHTVKRLRDICGFEGVKADTRALSTLVGIAKGDLRGCLNTLQVGLLVGFLPRPGIERMLGSKVHQVKE